jgi:hypothetical protein
MGDWVVVASIKIAEPMRLRYRFLNLQMHSATVNIADIASVNKILRKPWLCLRRPAP